MSTDIKVGDVVQVKYISEHRAGNITTVERWHRYLPNTVEIFPSINGSIFWHVDDLKVVGRDEKRYGAYTIIRGDQSCGCSNAKLHYLYDSDGNSLKIFPSYAEAEFAAVDKMINTDADSFHVFEVN